MTRHFGIAALIASVALGSTVTGQTSEYFVNSGDQATFSVLQGGARLRTWGTASGTAQYQYPIVVIDTVRTMGANAGDIGAEYSVDGVDLGSRYTHPLGGSGRAWDGTTDGVSNYAIDSSGDVYRYDRDWTNESLLFATPRGIGSLTFDLENGTMWVSSFGDTDITEYTMTGIILSSFSTGHTQNMALAYDHADGTLWLHDRTTQGTFEQWTRDGVRLQRIAVPGMSTQNALAGEFAFPASQFSLTVQGDCPGSTTLSVTGATPNGQVAFLYAFDQGSFVIPGGPCTGTQLGLDSSVQIGAVETADANGDASVTTNVPPAACGNVFVQAIDGGTCATSQVFGL
ncbi:MAG: hypothetical protein ACF8PN_16310 [Phycisphaerales bacterium]